MEEELVFLKANLKDFQKNCNAIHFSFTNEVIYLYIHTYTHMFVDVYKLMASIVIVKSTLIFYCIYLCMFGDCMSWHTCVCQKTTFQRQFSSSNM